MPGEMYHPHGRQFIEQAGVETERPAHPAQLFARRRPRRQIAAQCRRPAQGLARAVAIATKQQRFGLRRRAVIALVAIGGRQVFKIAKDGAGMRDAFAAARQPHKVLLEPRAQRRDILVVACVRELVFVIAGDRGLGGARPAERQHGAVLEPKIARMLLPGRAMPCHRPATSCRAPRIAAPARATPQGRRAAGRASLGYRSSSYPLCVGGSGDVQGGWIKRSIRTAGFAPSGFPYP